MHAVEPHQEPPSGPAYAAGGPRLLASYANYFEVGHNAFEFLIDAGQVEPGSGSVQLMNRIAISPVHAKLLAELLARSIAQFEAMHHAIPEIHDGRDADAELAILPPQEFERRAIDARSKPITAGQRAEPDSHQT